jgi:hypothetical protein
MHDSQEIRMKNNDKYGVGAEGDFSRLGASLMFLLVVCSCAMISAPAAASKDYMVKVLFNLDSDGNVVCPLPDVKDMVKENGVWQPVSGDLKLTSDKDTVFWQAYNLAGDTAGNNTYNIYFDPFKKPSAEAGNNDHGKTNTRKTKKKSEIPTGVFFKYTIWADVCPNDPKDPRFKVL